MIHAFHARTAACVAGLIAALLMAAPTSSEAACQPQCRIAIHVPADVQRPPEAAPTTVRAAPGDTIEFDSDGNVLIDFPEETPFVGPGGQPIYRFNVNGNRPMSIRQDSDVCGIEPGCKYNVIEPGTGRPPLDPYIIIDR